MKKLKKQKQKRHTHKKLRIALFIVLVLIILVVGFFRYINSPKLQSIIIGSINKVSTLSIDSGKFHLNILAKKLDIENITLTNTKSGHKYHADKVFIKFSLLPLLRGQIKIGELKTEGVEIEIPKSVKKKKARRRRKISLTKLLLLRNLTVNSGEVKRGKVILPNGEAGVTEVSFSFIPKLLGDIGLNIKLTSPNYRPKNKPEVSAKEILIRGITNVNNWLNEVPFVNDLRGKVTVENLHWDKIDVDRLAISTSYSNGYAKLLPLTATISGRTILVTGDVNKDTEKFSLNIHIPQAIPMPTLGGRKPFFNTKGFLSGNIFIDGKGFDPKKTAAEAEINLTHILHGGNELIATLESGLNISGGRISINTATLKVGNTTVGVSGSFNIKPPSFDLSFEGSDIPAEAVLSRFTDEHFHPITGKAKVIGKFTGWKPNYLLDLDISASPASYHDIVVDSLTMTIDLTYQRLDLVGQIYQDGVETGNANLVMNFGGKLADGTRDKNFDLVANLISHNLGPSMMKYNLEGTSTGTLHLSGKPKAYNGTADAAIDNGAFKNIGFMRTRSKLNFTTDKITFNDIQIATSETNPAIFPNPIEMDFHAGSGLHLHGIPREGLTIDTRYNYASGMWNISNISYSTPENPTWETTLSGSISKEGGLNLKLDGTLDTQVIKYLRSSIRNASGPAKLTNIHISGTTTNPAISGSLNFEGNSVQPRGWGYPIEELVGELNFSGHIIKIPEVKGRIEYGDFVLMGDITHQETELSHADITFTGKSIHFATRDRSFKMEMDCDLNFSGTPFGSELKGDIAILDGRYTKNFSIIEKLKEPRMPKEIGIVEEGEWQNLRLDLKVKNTGDLMIDNNVGTIWLRTDLNLKGTQLYPKAFGNIQTVGGEIHYAGLDFEVTRGIVEFRDNYTNPYIELSAAKEVSQYNIILILRGRTDRLFLDLQSTPPLDRKDIIALLTFGITEADLRQAHFGAQLGTGFLAEQVTALISRPVTKFTPLDRFRIETSPTGRSDLTRLYMGKDISDRLRINLITDINTAEAQQTVQAEYLITDFLLLKGSSSSGSKYKFNLSFRFREQ